MSRLKELIEHLADNQRSVHVHVPGTGYIWAKVASIDDDTVTLDPEKGNRIIMHYTQFSVKQD